MDLLGIFERNGYVLSLLVLQRSREKVISYQVACNIGLCS